jgi:uncharacterized protein YndB with AHSA1/START domain
MNQPATTTETIVEEISIKGSAERIFEALADAKQRLKWWGAKGAYQSTDLESDLRVGGKWMMKGTGMSGPFTCHGEYTRIDRPESSSLPGTPVGKMTTWNQSSASNWTRKTA